MVKEPYSYAMEVLVSNEKEHSIESYKNVRITLSVKSQSHKVMYCMIAFM
jgi:hypothetical protein